jgi:hypothetical protein
MFVSADRSHVTRSELAMRLAPSALALLTVTLALAACGGSSFRVRGAPEPPAENPIPGPDVLGDPDRGAMDTPLADMRQACRAGAVPRGWIAVDYMELQGRCPKADHYGGYNGVLLQYYENRMVGSVLVVCADQPTPNGWIRSGEPENEVCSGARVDVGESTTKYIKRMR